MKRRLFWLCFAACGLTVLFFGPTVALFIGITVPGTQARYFPPPPPEPGHHAVSVLGTELIVPGDLMPPEVVRMEANNNLAVTRHGGRVYLAWRTAPDHFAGKDAIIQVMSSDAEEQLWRFEHRIGIGTDVREPQLLSLNGSLFLYFSKLGVDPYAFAPQGIFVSERKEDGAWSAPASIGLDGYVGWRVRMENRIAYLSAYHGGEHIYAFNSKPLRVDIFTSADGRTWLPVSAKKPSVYVGGGSEMDFTFGSDGTLYAVIRNESGDDRGYGSLLCTAPPTNMLDWTCVADLKKYDSPYVFRHDGEVYVVARRNVTEDGAFDLRSGFGALRGIINQLSYVTKAKRCSLWRFADGGKRLAFMLDLPSRGDTCYPAVLDTEFAYDVAIYDYSSPLLGPDSPWSVGQRGPTFIYRHVLRFTPEQKL